MEALKEKTIRGGVAKIAGQLVGMALRIGTLAMLARLLAPGDFGLVAMVTVVTGMLEVFATGGLLSATVQKADITYEQISTLFWINVLIGGVLALLCLAMAPLLDFFYNEPRAALVIPAVAPAFLINAMGVQHSALLHRQMRYATLSAIEVGSQAAASAISICMALAGFGYWALVVGLIAAPLVSTVAAWVASGWVPGRFHQASGVSSLLRFGGTITLNGLVVYAAYNLDKVLLGRYFGTDALGLYGRAYQLINAPTQTLNGALGVVAFAALSRLQLEPDRFRTYFLKGYSLVVSITLPATILCTTLADDIILVTLGPKWTEATPIFRLLAPTIMVFGMINPLAWLLQSIGLQRRSLNIALVLAPIIIGAYLIGTPYGPIGVAIAYSAAMTLFLIPCILWCVHGTPISAVDLMFAIAKPAAAGIAAALAAALVQHTASSIPFAFVRLALSSSVLLLVYGVILVFAMNQKELYLDLLRGLRTTSMSGADQDREKARSRAPS